MKRLAIIKRIVSIIFGSISVYLLISILYFLIFSDTHPRFSDFALVIGLVSIVLFFILWNLIRSKLVYLFIIAIAGSITIITVEERRRQHELQELRMADNERRIARSIQQQAEREPEGDRVIAERAQMEVEREARRARADTIMYVASPFGLSVRDTPSHSGRVILSLSYATEVKISMQDKVTAINDEEWVFILAENIEGWVLYHHITETIIPESILGLWYQARDITWNFYSNNNFSQDCWATGWERSGTFELDGNNRIVLTFDYFEFRGNMLDRLDLLDVVPQRFFYIREAEIYFSNIRKTILKFDDHKIILRRF